MSNQLFTGEKSRVMVRIMQLYHTGWTGTREELAQRVYSSARNLENYLCLLRECGLSRIVAWRRNHKGRGCSWIGLYGFGDGLPNTSMPTRDCAERFDARSSKNADAVLEYLRSTGAQCVQEVATYFGWSHEYARTVLRAMREQGMAHVLGYERRTAGHPIMIYAPGPGQDATKPRPLTSTELNRRRKQILTQKFGPEIAARIMLSRKEGGPDKIVLEGRVVHARQPPRGGRKASA